MLNMLVLGNARLIPGVMYLVFGIAMSAATVILITICVALGSASYPASYPQS